MLKMKLIASVMLIVLTTALIGGLTGAWFTDADNAGTATFTAGTLDVDVSKGLTELDVAQLSNMEPGDVSDEITINIMNKGTKNLAWFGNWTFKPETPGEGKLLDKIYIKSMGMYFLDENGAAWGPDWYQGYNFIENGRGNLVPFTVGDNQGEKTAFDLIADESEDGVITLRNWNDNNTMMLNSIYEHMGALKPGNNKVVIKVVFGFHESANFKYMGNADGVSPITIGFEVIATQVNVDAINDLIPGKGTAHMSHFEGHLSMQP